MYIVACVCRKNEGKHQSICEGGSECPIGAGICCLFCQSDDLGCEDTLRAVSRKISGLLNHGPNPGIMYQFSLAEI